MERETILYNEDTYEILLKESTNLRGNLQVRDFTLYNGQEPCPYWGGIVIGKDLGNTFEFTNDYPCYCYEKVIELIFNEGKLITTADHSKAMNRIRLNIKKGLRSLKNQQDLICINKFLRSSFIKKYSGRFNFNRWWLFRRRH